MDNQPHNPQTSPKESEPLLKKSLTRTEVLCYCALTGLVLIFLSTKGSLFEETPKGSSSESLESVSSVSRADSLVWGNIDAETRKSLAVMKLQDAEQLANELEALLKMSGSRISADENRGQGKSWLHGVDFILGEIAEAGFKADRDDTASAMGQVHAALQSMRFAWDRSLKIASATSDEDRKSHATARSRELNLMRNHLEYAREWLAKERY